MTIPSSHHLGATLYMPATRKDIADCLINCTIKGLRSVVICLEDSVIAQDIPAALRNLRKVLTDLREADFKSITERPIVFIRPRNIEMAQQLTESEDLSFVDGLVLPKFTRASLPAWWEIVKNSHLCMMPTLETEDVFDVSQMRELALMLQTHPCYERIIALRIGGNDLMSTISLRRPKNVTLYEGPIGYVIKMLVSVFAPKGFSLTSPVCDHIDDHHILEQEIALDITHGLVGKTVIHPNQIEVIQRHLMVSSTDHADALRIVASNKGVFKSHGSMCEPATHKRWAERILECAKIYGVTQGDTQDDFIQEGKVG